MPEVGVPFSFQECARVLRETRVRLHVKGLEKLQVSGSQSSSNGKGPRKGEKEDDRGV